MGVESSTAGPAFGPGARVELRVPARESNLSDLRAGSLTRMVLLSSAIGLIWFDVMAWPGVDRGPRALAGWVGVLVLLSAAAASELLRGRSVALASALLTAGVWLAALCAQLLLPTDQGTYLFIFPILVASVLSGPTAALACAGAGGLAGLLIGTRLWGLGLLSPDVWLPMAMILAATLAVRLLTRNLYTALDWAWSSYERACRNEEAARAGQAELRRVLKALDEATYRLERTNRMLSVARDEAEQARRLKQQFAQTVSHELRTPLNLVVGFTELMLKSPEYYGSPLPIPYSRDLTIVHRNACHLQTLVNDVLDLARIEAAQLSITFEQVDPACLVHQVGEAVRSLVDVRGLELRLEVEPGLPTVWLDPTRIRQVLFNLINNAVRFTERGSVTVAVRRKEDKIEFRVTDTGIGIAPSDIPRAFEEFQQLDGTTKRRHGGTGLGLAISKRFVDLHGGRIWAESQLGQGSSFFFELPLSGPDAAAVPGLHTSVATLSCAAPEDEALLVVVTQSPAGAALLSRYLPNCRVVAFRDLEQARLAAGRILPQGVVIDTVLTKLNSRSLENLARQWSLPHTLFVACPLPGEDLFRRQLAVDGYLTKPITQDQLWDVLRPFGEGIDRLLVIDDEEDFVRLITRLLQNPLRRYQVVPAYTGRQGLEQMARSAPDLVLLDLSLPDMEGSEVARRIRANAAWRRVPIVAVSAQEGGTGEHGALAGAVTVVKPGGVSGGELVRWLGALIRPKA